MLPTISPFLIPHSPFPNPSSQSQSLIPVPNPSPSPSCLTIELPNKSICNKCNNHFQIRRAGCSWVTKVLKIKNCDHWKFEHSHHQRSFSLLIFTMPSRLVIAVAHCPVTAWPPHVSPGGGAGDWRLEPQRGVTLRHQIIYLRSLASRFVLQSNVNINWRNIEQSYWKCHITGIILKFSY